MRPRVTPWRDRYESHIDAFHAGSRAAKPNANIVVEVRWEGFWFDGRVIEAVDRFEEAGEALFQATRSIPSRRTCRAACRGAIRRTVPARGPNVS